MLLAGEVGKPHGLAGEVYVVRISDDPQRFESGSTLTRSDGTELRIASARAHGERLLVKFEGVDDRDTADLLRGPLYVTPRSLRSLEEDEYWHHDLINMTAVEDTGMPLGVVVDVVAGPAQDLLQLDTPIGTRLVPLVSEIVGEVDTGARTVTLHPPEGLLD
ncbi:MAG: ribosome maturation factor RimM [Actinomycetota bacterium]